MNFSYLKTYKSGALAQFNGSCVGLTLYTLRVTYIFYSSKGHPLELGGLRFQALALVIVLCFGGKCLSSTHETRSNLRLTNIPSMQE